MRPDSTILADMEACGMKVDPLTTALVFGYESGLVQQNVFYANVRGEDLKAGYVAHFQTEAADAIMQLRCLLALHGLNLEDTIRMGETKVYERMADFVDCYRPRPDGTTWSEPERQRMVRRVDAVLHPSVPNYKHNGD